MSKINDPTTDQQIHAGRREKLRRSFLDFGLVSFSETQVLEYALGLVIPRIDTNPTAHRLVNTFGSLTGVIDAHPDKLRAVSGIGEQAAIFLNFLKQFVTYYRRAARDTAAKITTPAEAIGMLREIMSTYTTEQFVLLCLDKSGAIILEQTTTGGDTDRVDLNLRQIVDIVLRVRTASVIIAHNHLGESSAPSDADVHLTRWLVNVLTPLNVRVMDHIIFAAAGAVFSFHEQKLLEIFIREYKNFAENPNFKKYLD